MFSRDYCCECGRPETRWSAFKRWLRWTKLGRWWKPYVPNPLYAKYFDEKLLKHAATSFINSQFGKPKEFPKGDTIRLPHE